MRKPIHLIMISIPLFVVFSCGYKPVADDGRNIITFEDAWEFYPGFSEKINAVGDVFYDGKSGLSSQVIELCALVTSRYWGAESDWQVHEDAALEAGLGSDIIEAVKNWQYPDFKGDTELSTAYGYATEILTYKNITEVMYKNVVDEFGKKGAVELAGLLGHHTMIAFTIKAFRLKPETPIDFPSGEWDITPDHSEVEHPRPACWGYPFSNKGWPMNACLSYAENMLGTAFPFQTDKLSEFCIVLTARDWDCEVPWSAHVPSAVSTGMTPDAIRAIGLGETPVQYLTEDEQALYRFAAVLFDNTTEMDDATYDMAVAFFGRPLLVKLVTVMGYYSQVALVVNTVNYTLYPLPQYPFPIE
ncbi:MAG: carboxymuconolactone decarboxylase family protein [Proteobacteria bacterium]|nr:carboxymuconolactone decarboxylase family protein [Pseudomonadota bacterium]